MNEQVKASILGSFVADAMALGTHWEYDTSKIAKNYGHLDHYVTPELQSYHTGKHAGDWTHYGDQAYELMISVDHTKTFDPQDYMVRWRALFNSDRTVYVDKASTDALEHSLSCSPEYAKCGSASSDLGGASRIAPLLAVYADNREGLIDAARKQTELTHNTPEVVEAARFFAEVTYRVLQGKKPGESIATVLRELKGAGSPIAGFVEQGFECTVENPVTTVKELGQSCGVSGALPATVYLIMHFEDNFKEALIQNTLAGGDSAARGMLVGMVLGAYHGMNGIPAGWVEGLSKHTELIDTMEGRAHHAYYEYETVEAY